MKIGIMNYFATGEGVTLYVISGQTEKEILEHSDDYFHRAFEFYDAKELYDYIKSKKDDNEDFEMAKEILHYHVPLFYKYFYQSGACHINYQMHYNLS